MLLFLPSFLYPNKIFSHSRNVICLYEPCWNVEKQTRNGIVLYTGPRIRPPKPNLRGHSVFRRLWSHSHRPTRHLVCDAEYAEHGTKNRRIRRSLPRPCFVRRGRIGRLHHALDGSTIKRWNRCKPDRTNHEPDPSKYDRHRHCGTQLIEPSIANPTLRSPYPPHFITRAKRVGYLYGTRRNEVPRTKIETLFIYVVVYKQNRNIL